MFRSHTTWHALTLQNAGQAEDVFYYFIKLTHTPCSQDEHAERVLVQGRVNSGFLQLCSVVSHAFSRLVRNSLLTKQKGVILSFQPWCADLDVLKVQFVDQAIVVISQRSFTCLKRKKYTLHLFNQMTENSVVCASDSTADKLLLHRVHHKGDRAQSPQRCGKD